MGKMIILNLTIQYMFTRLYGQKYKIMTSYTRIST